MAFKSVLKLSCSVHAGALSSTERDGVIFVDSALDILFHVPVNVLPQS